MADEEDDELEEAGDDGKVEAINSALLDLIGESVKLGIVLAELSPKQLAGVQSRWNALVASVNAVKLKPTTQKKHLT